MSIVDKFNMTDYCSIVTGGATGLGRAMAESLAEMGSHIVIADIDGKRAQEVALEMHENKGVQVLSIEADVTNVTDVERIAREATNTFKKIDVLLNNAGIVRNEKAEKMTLQDWNDVINVNLNGVFLMSQAVGKVMINQTKGSIIRAC